MRTFAQKQNQPQKPVSSNAARSHTATPGLHHRTDLILHLQRTIGNQAMQRMLQTNAEELKAGVTDTTPSRFGHDVRRTPIHPSAVGAIQMKLAINRPGDEYEQEADRVSERVMRMPELRLQHPCVCGVDCPKCRSQREQPSQNTEHLQTKRVGESVADVSEAPPAVNEVIRSPSQSLDPKVRAFMESRFGHDFGQVRVHSDAGAAQSADAVNARAYCVGDDLVFGRGEYAPGSAQGRSLIAHELAHVVQQRNAIDPRPILRRAAKRAKTPAGEFVADPYDATHVLGAGGITTGYGADITITFKANDQVDAEKIAFVQTALSMKDGKVHNKFDTDEKKKKVNESRMIPSGQRGAGTHIDQLPDVRTPLYGTTGNRGDDISQPEPAKTLKLTEIGWHYKDASGNPQNHDAMMHDEPDINSGDIYTKASDVMSKGWSQQFETSALAIAGNQKGTFYGSVEWGWKRSVSDEGTHLSEFKTKSETVASPTFIEAAKLWNVSVTTENKATIGLPVDVHVTSQRADLWDSPDQRRRIAILTKDTPLGRTAKVDPKGRIWWASVIVTGGPNVGKTGWVKEVDLY
jgi:uncharacterized protein DUF4157